MKTIAAALLLALASLLFLACTDAGRAAQGPEASANSMPAAQAVEAPVVTPVAEVQEVRAVVTEAPAQDRIVVVLDPGHGGEEVGAARFGVVEKHSNLDFALRVEQLLLQSGVDVVLTRRTDARAAPSLPGQTPARNDLQTRLDIANAAGGDVFVSIHSNGSEDPGLNGVEAWFDSNRSYAEEGRRLAGLLKDRVLDALRGYGYRATDRGLFDGKCYRQREGRCFTLFVIGGPRATTRDEVLRRGGDPVALGFGDADVIYSRPAEMPSALIELLFISNERDAAVLRDEAGRQAIARGVARAILEFLGLPAADF